MNEQLFKDAYKIIDDYSSLKNDLKANQNELELTKLDLELASSELDKLNDQVSDLLKENEKLSYDINVLKTKSENENKKILKFKTLLQIIISEYGYDEISRLTKLNKDKLKDI